MKSKSGWFERFARRAVLARLQGLRVGRLRLHDAPGSALSMGAAGGRALPTVFGQAEAAAGELDCQIFVHDPRFYVDVVCRGTVGAAEAYAAGRWSCDDPTRLVRLLIRNRAVLDSMEGGLARLAAPLLRAYHALRPNTRRGSRRNIAAHYDLGNSFFEQFLDATMTYSCALFTDPRATLAEASVQKLDRLCQKLALASGDRLIEIGSGWGSMAIHAAANYGCHVTTTTISAQQHAYASRRIRELGLADRVTLLLEDYRDLQGRYDKLVSVEMIEAVGHRQLGTYMKKVSDLLEDDGIAALQVITIQDQHYARAVREVDFIKRYIFPGSFIPCVDAVSRAMTEHTDLRMFHLEDMAPHYAETLARWQRNLQQNWQAIRGLGHDEDFLRLWSYYLSYCEGGFAERFLGVSQIVFTKPQCRRDAIVPPLRSAAWSPNPLHAGSVVEEARSFRATAEAASAESAVAGLPSVGVTRGPVPSRNGLSSAS